MSHFSQIQSSFTNKLALKRALERLGFTPEVYEQATEVVNTWGDYAEAEIILRRQTISEDRPCQADLGFQWDPESACYKIVADSYEFDYSTLKEKFQNLENFQAQLTVAYELEMLPILYNKSSFDIAEPIQHENGSYTVTITQKVDPYAEVTV
jgi:hypothetical protein